MTLEIIDIMLDYLRIVAYAIVILSSLRGIIHRKFSNILFLGDIIIATAMVSIVIIIHLYEISVASTLADDIILTTGAVTWAIIHFISMLKSSK